MTHRMNLVDFAFKLIKSGKKKIEVRLYDEKRRKIKENDFIEFNNLETGELLKVKVIKLHLFKSFKELFDNFDNNIIGVDNYNVLYDFYTKDEENEFGVVGIEIKLVKGDE